MPHAQPISFFSTLPFPMPFLALINAIGSKVKLIAAVYFILLARNVLPVYEAVRGKADSTGTNSVDVAVEKVLRFVIS